MTSSGGLVKNAAKKVRTLAIVKVMSCSKRESSKIVAQRCDAINTAGSSIETGVVLGLDYTSLNATGVTLNEVTR
jgi:hypothetical protein